MSNVKVARVTDKKHSLLTSRVWNNNFKLYMRNIKWTILDDARIPLSWDWRDGSAFKNTYCSYRRHKVSIQVRKPRNTAGISLFWSLRIPTHTYGRLTK